MTDYSKGKIYRLFDCDTGESYYGSTCLTLVVRLDGHRGDYQQWLKNNARYCTSYQILERNNYGIELMENYPCNSKEELRMREQFYLDTYENINDTRAYVSEEILKQEARERANAYYHEHKEEIRAKAVYNPEKRKERLEKDKNTYIECECGETIKKTCIAKHRRRKGCSKN